MADTGFRFNSYQVACRCFEKLQHGFVFPRRSICNIHQYLCSRYCLGQTFSGNRSMPTEGDAGMTSWPCERSKVTSFAPIKPVPPTIIIFTLLFLVSDGF